MIKISSLTLPAAALLACLAIVGMTLTAYGLGRMSAEESLAKAENALNDRLADRLSNMQDNLVQHCQTRLTQFCNGDNCPKEMDEPRADAWSRILGIETTMSVLTAAHTDMQQKCESALNRSSDVADIVNIVNEIKAQVVESGKKIVEIQSDLATSNPERTIGNAVAEIRSDTAAILQTLSGTSTEGETPLSRLWATLREVDESLSDQAALLGEVNAQMSTMQDQLAKESLNFEAVDSSVDDNDIRISIKLPLGLIHSCDDFTLYMQGNWLPGREMDGTYPMLRAGRLEREGGELTCVAEPDFDLATVEESGVDLSDTKLFLIGGPGFQLGDITLPRSE